MSIRGRRRLREAYRGEAVADGYSGRRFAQPLGALLHARQAAALRRAIAGAQPRKTLEIACGPARLTAAAAAALDGSLVAADANHGMLRTARRRLASASGGGSCALVQADAFELPFAGPFDLVYTFRFLRHFEEADRARLYAAIRRLLRPGGLLLFDAVNEVVSAPLRAAAPQDYPIYDVLYRPEPLRAELAAVGFEVVELTGVQHRYGLLRRLQILLGPRSPRLARLALELVDRSGGEALEWVVTCRRG